MKNNRSRIGVVKRMSLGLFVFGLAVWFLPAAHSDVVYETTQTYYFKTNSTSLSSADVATNSYGAAPATIILGPFANGWMDPAELFHLASYDGAWDLGSNGTIRASVPFTSTPNGMHQIELLVDMIAYIDAPLFVAPTLTLSGTILQSGTTLTTLDHVDPNFGGSWTHIIWSNVVIQLNDIGTVDVTLTAGPDGGTVDQLSIKTIPEPSAFVLVGGVLGFFLGGRLASRLFRRLRNK